MSLLDLIDLGETIRVPAECIVEVDGAEITHLYAYLTEVTVEAARGQPTVCRLGFETEHLMEPGGVYALDVAMSSTSLVVNAGHALRVSITSSSFPRFEPNPNTGEPFRQHTGQRVARNTIHLAAPAASWIELPVVSN